MIQFMKLHPNAVIPKIQREGDAGFDIYALNDIYVKWGATTTVDTGISVAVPSGWVGFVKPRSGEAFKVALNTMAGTIDSNYRGEIKVLLTIQDHERSKRYKAGDRIAQLVVLPCMTQACEVETLDDTERGIKGFGSTGL